MAFMSFTLNDEWKFQRNPPTNAIQPDYDDSSWRTVSLPHDWCVDESFTPDACGGARNAWLPQGIACYRLRVTPTMHDTSLRPVLRFGGIAGNSVVYLNGIKVGGEEWAFAPLEIELDSAWKTDGENIIAVWVDQSHTPVCRWYEGAGIFRTVTLEYRPCMVEMVSNGLFVHTVSIGEDRKSAVINLQFRLKNRTEKRLCVILNAKVTDPSGNIVFSEKNPHTIPATHEMWNMDGKKYTIQNPVLWTPETPALYTLNCTLELGSKIIDTETVHFGIRTAQFDANRGFLLNGIPVKLNGVCLHNDLGAMGVACTSKGIRRQLEILKSIGCNAVRTAHNPFGENFLDECDSVGMLVLAEFFDEWSEPQLAAPMSDGEFLAMNVHYYSHLFEKRATQDINRITRRDRNHPSIILWSIGNEVKQMNKFSGKYIAGQLQEAVHYADPTRLVTCAVVMHNICHENIDVLDVGGYNYPSAGQLDDFHTRHSNQPMVVTECYSAQTRRPLGQDTINGILPGGECTYLETTDFVSWFERMQWGYDAWKAAGERDFVAGSFLWTGFDYLGETTPYDFPAHSAFFGIFDLCGFPKDGAYFYQSVWKPQKPLIHIANHWDAKIGDSYFVTVISNCATCELQLNGTTVERWNNERIHCMNIPYETGELCAIGKDTQGIEVVRDVVHTSGNPKNIVLTPYFGSALKADGHDLEFVKCEVVDETGQRIFNTDFPVTFTVTGAGTLEALDNGLQTSLEPFRGTNVRHTCAGRCMAIVKAGKQGGKITIRASVQGLQDAILEFEVL